MVKRKKMKGGAENVPTLTKQEVLQDPKIQEALRTWSVQQGGGAMKQFGGGWWSDFVGWLKRNKVISGISKVGSAIASATGFVPLATALGAVATGASTFGYGRKMRVRPRAMMGGSLQATSIAMPGFSSSIPHLKW